MARPKRTTEEEWYDVFSQWDVEDQAVAIRVLNQIHRLAKRQKPQVTVGAAPGFDELRVRIADTQQSFTGLPDEDQR